jgi:methylenetetrahydrofolate dehydrogenase (NADP+) / methenyltetrahydrofolate cyclohydrolase
MTLMDGQLVSKATLEELKGRVKELRAAGRKTPHLAAVLIGSNGASETYVASKVKTCGEIGYKSTLIRMEDSIGEQDLLDTIGKLNDDDDIDGILVQLPLPAGIAERKVINAIAPEKDVDGFHPVNVGKLVQGLASFIPATPYGIMLLLEYYGIDTKGMNAAVIGRSNIVGRPMSILLSSAGTPGNCTVTLCHSHTKNLKEICLRSDLIVAALGRPEFLRGDMVKDGAIVIDVGITRVTDPSKKKGYAIKGDVHFGEVSPKCSYITPVPGGVGLMTIAGLMKNTYTACTNKHN